MRGRVRENLATFLVFLLSAVAIILAIAGILRSGFHDPVWLSFIANLTIAIANVILMWQSVDISRRQVESQRHPYLSPRYPPSSGVLVNYSRKWFEYNDINIQIFNSGPGTAMQICGILMLQPDAPTVRPRQFLSSGGNLQILPQEHTEILFLEIPESGKRFTGKERIGGIPLGVPREEKKIARLTLTWRDRDGLKHVAVFDLIRGLDDQETWSPVGYRGKIRKDLWDLISKV